MGSVRGNETNFSLKKRKRGGVEICLLDINMKFNLKDKFRVSNNNVFVGVTTIESGILIPCERRVNRYASKFTGTSLVKSAENDLTLKLDSSSKLQK